MVHSSGRVKIGDFGMTRPIIESEYYRFTKKGNSSNTKQPNCCHKKNPKEDPTILM